ncbi:MAG: hypothetical protein IK096_03585, partial [Lachnospiraceae bacterium]|nr:hypothetical protein [Lachnospiraceae bacterium]
KDRFRPLTAAIVNLALSLLSVRPFGLYGILIATVISVVFVQLPWLLHNLFLEIFPREYMKPYILSLCALTAVTVLSCMGAYGLCGMLSLSGWKALVVNGVISFAASNLLCFLYYGRDPVFRQTVRHVIREVTRRAEKH